MKEAITYGGLTALPGTKKSGWAPVLDTEKTMPLTVINGAGKGRTALVTAGIHGGEYPCIECAIRLAREIDPAEVSGQIVIFHPVNYDAFIQRRAYIVPEDGKNLNRQFPPDPNGTISQKMAHVLTEEYIKRADFHLDMHGGDIPESLPPYVYYAGVGNEAVVARAEAAAAVVHANFVVRSSATTGMYNYSTIIGTPSILVELGGRGLWSEEEVKDYLRNAYNVLKHLDILPGEPDAPKEKAYVIRKAEYIDATVNGCWYPLVGLEERVGQGQLLGVVKDVFGNVLEEVRAEYDAMILFKTVSLAIEKGEAIITYGI